jgi:hypothetical protein
MATTKYSKTKVSPTQRRAIVGGWDMYDPYAYERERLAAEAGQSTQRQALALQKVQSDRAHAIQREALANQNAASTVSGITGLLGTGAQLYMMKNLFQNPFLDPNQSQEMIDLIDEGLADWDTPSGNAQAQQLRAITSQAPMSAIPSSAIGSTPGVATAASPTNYTPMGSHISGGTFGTVTHNIPGLPQGITTQYPGIGGAGVPVGGSMGGGAAITPGASISTSAATTPGLPSLSSSLPGGSLAEAGSGMATASTITPGSMIGVAMPYVAPAAAGYAAPGVLNMVHEGATENIGKALGISHSKTASTVGGGIAGAAAGAAIGAALTAWSGPGAVIGGIIGAIGGAIGGGGGGTWLCTAINKHVGMDEREKLDVIRLRKYALENHETMMLFYLNQGDGLVKAIEVEEGGLVEEFYARLKTNMLTPCLELVREKKLEEAYELYRDYTTELFNHYTPGLELPKETKVDTEGGE